MSSWFSSLCTHTCAVVFVVPVVVETPEETEPAGFVVDWVGTMTLAVVPEGRVVTAPDCVDCVDRVDCADCVVVAVLLSGSFCALHPQNRMESDSTKQNSFFTKNLLRCRKIKSSVCSSAVPQPGHRCRIPQHNRTGFHCAIRARWPAVGLPCLHWKSSCGEWSPSERVCHA